MESTGFISNISIILVFGYMIPFILSVCLLAEVESDREKAMCYGVFFHVIFLISIILLLSVLPFMVAQR